MELISRKQAIAAGLTKYFTGKPCKQGHLSERRVSGRCCVVCANSTSKQWAKSNTERAKSIRSKWDDSNRIKTAERVQTYRLANPEKVNQSIQNWRINNAVKYKAYMNFAAAKRKADKEQRTPNWLNSGHFFEMECVYTFCQAIRDIGLDYEVDHIVPLRGKAVSGFHVPWNLQVIPTAENRSKGNR